MNKTAHEYAHSYPYRMSYLPVSTDTTSSYHSDQIA